MTLPRGIRTCNPFNLRWHASIKWQGLAGRDEHGMCVFQGDPNSEPPDAFWGLRAGFKDLRTGFIRDGEDTIDEIIAEFAPPSENDTESYIRSVVAATDWDRHKQIALTVDNLVLLGRAIIRHENGVQPYTVEQIKSAAFAALNS